MKTIVIKRITQTGHGRVSNSTPSLPLKNSGVARPRAAYCMGANPMKTILIALALTFAVIGGTVAIYASTSPPAHASCEGC